MAVWMITARFLPSLKTFRTPNPYPLSRLLTWEAPKWTHSRSPLMSVMALNLVLRHGAVRFLFHAFRFFKTIRIEIQGMKKNKPTASLVSPMPQ